MQVKPEILLRSWWEVSLDSLWPNPVAVPHDAGSHRGDIATAVSVVWAPRKDQLAHFNIRSVITSPPP